MRKRRGKKKKNLFLSPKKNLFLSSRLSLFLEKGTSFERAAAGGGLAKRLRKEKKGDRRKNQGFLFFRSPCLSRPKPHPRAARLALSPAAAGARWRSARPEGRGCAEEGGRRARLARARQDRERTAVGLLISELNPRTKARLSTALSASNWASRDLVSSRTTMRQSLAFTDARGGRERGPQGGSAGRVKKEQKR